MAGEKVDKISGLNFMEGLVMSCLGEALEAYMELPIQHSHDREEFVTGIHICQGLLMQRIVRRKYPKYWACKKGGK